MLNNTKKTNIKWIGRVPFRWGVLKVKNCFDIQLGKMVQPTSKNENDSFEKYLCSANLSNNSLDLTDIKEMWINEQEKTYLELHDGDLLVVEGGSVGNCDIVHDIPAGIYFQNSLMRVTPKGGNDLNFLKYQIWNANTCGYMDSVCNKATITHFTKTKFKNMPFLCPSCEEQQQIAAYLDAKCAKIDEAITKHRTLIEKLKEYRKAVITKAVTKGLDPNAEMKDSGIPWIRKIPVLWETPKIKMTAIFINGDRSENYPSDKDWKSEGVCFLTSDNIHNIEVELNTAKSKYISEEKYKSLRGVKLTHDDIVYCLRGSLGLCSINKTLEEGTVASSLVVIRCKKDTLPDYMNYYLHSDVVQYQTDSYMNGSCAANLSAQNVSNYYFIEPPYNEQLAIVTFLNTKCAKIDEAIARHEGLITKLEEYKKSIIYNAVTGKIDCRKDAE